MNQYQLCAEGPDRQVVCTFAQAEEPEAALDRCQREFPTTEGFTLHTATDIATRKIYHSQPIAKLTALPLDSPITPEQRATEFANVDFILKERRKYERQPEDPWDPERRARILAGLSGLTALPIDEVDSDAK